MVEVTATMVKELRDKTGCGMMQCKKALQDTNGDVDAAVEYLRKKGAETATKRAGRTSKEGKIDTRIDSGVAAILEVNSETDFVARNHDFVAFADQVLDLVLKGKSQNMDELMAAKMPSGLTVAQALNDLLAKIGENIGVRRFERLVYDKTKARVFSYIHGAGKIGVLLEMGTENGSNLNHPEFENLGKNLTLQIAASNPLAIRRDQLDSALMEKEREIYRTQALNEGKPEKILDRIVEGKMAKYYQDVCLVEQPYVKETDRFVQDIVGQAEKAIGAKVVISRFVRFVLGGNA